MVSLIGGSNVNALEVRLEGDATDLESTLADAAANIRRFKTMVVTAGTAMAVGGAAGIAAATSAAESWNEVQREMLKTTDSVEVTRNLSKAMRDMSSEIPIAVNKLGDLAAQAARFGIRGQENIETFVETVGKMAAATDLSTERAAESFAKLATLTGTPVKEMENLGSSIAILENTMATSSEEIVKNSLRSSASLSALGMHQADIMAVAAALNESTHSARRAGTYLRRLGQDLMDPSKVPSFARALGVTNDQFKRMRDEDPTGTILTLARVMDEGGEGASKLNANLTSITRKSLQALGQNLEDTNAALERSNEHYKEAAQLQREFEIQTDSLYDRLQLLKNVIRDIGISIGNVFVPKLEDLIDRILPVLEGFNDWVKAGGDVRVAMTMLGMTIGGVIPVIAFFAQILGPLKPLMLGTTLAAASLAKTFALLATPIIAFGVAWRKNVLGVADEMRRIGGAIREEVYLIIGAFNTMVDDVLSTSMGEVGELGDELREVMRGIVRIIANKVIWIFRQLGKTIRDVMNAVGPLVEEVVRIMNKIWERHGYTIMRVAGRIDTALVRLDEAFMSLEGSSETLKRALIPVALAFTVIGGKIGLIIGTIVALREAWTNNFLGIQDKTRETLRVIEDAFFQVMDKVDMIINTTLDEMEALWSEHGEQITNSVTKTVEDVRNALEVGLAATVENLVTILTPLVEGLQRLWDNHAARTGRVIKELSKLILYVFGGAVTAVADIVRRVVAVLTDLWKAHGDEIVTEIAGWIDTFMRLIDLLIGTFQPMVEKVLVWINSLFEEHGGALTKIWEFVMDTLQVLTEIGLDAIITVVLVFSRVLRGIVDTLMLVLQGNWGEAWDRLKEMVANTVPLITGLVKRTFGNLAEWFNEWAGWIVVAIVGAWKSVKQRVKEAVGGVVSSIHNRLNPVISFLSGWGGRILGVVRNALFGAYDAIRNALGRALTFLTSWSPNVLQIVGGALHGIYRTVKNALGNALDFILGWIPNIEISLKKPFKAAVSIIKSSLNSAYNFLVTWGQRILAPISGPLNRAKQLFKTALGAIYNNIVVPILNRIGIAWDTHGQDIMNKITEIKNTILQTWNLIRSGAKKAVGAIKEDWTVMFKLIFIAIKLVMLRITERIRRAWNIIETISKVAWNLVKDEVKAAMGAIKSGIQTAMNIVVPKLKEAWNIIKTATMSTWRDIKSEVKLAWRLISTLIDVAIAIIVPKVRAAWSTIKSATMTAWQSVKDELKAAWNIITTAVDVALAILTPKIKRAWRTIKTVTKIVWTVVGKKIHAVWQDIKAVISTALDILVPKLKRAWEAIKTATRLTWNLIKDIITIVTGTILKVIEPWLDLIEGQMRDTWEVIKSVVNVVWKGILTAIEITAQLILGTIRVFLNLMTGDWEGAWTAAKDMFVGIWDAIKRYLNGAVSDLLRTLGNYIVNTLTRMGTFASRLLGMWIDMWDSIIQRTMDFIGNVKDAIGSFLNDLWDKFWDFATDLIFGSLIRDMWNEVFNVTKDTMGKIKDKISNILGKIKEIFSKILGKIKDLVSTNISKAKDAVASGLNTMKSKVRSKLERIVGIFSSKFSKVKGIAQDIMGKARDAARTASRKLSDARDAVQSAKDYASQTVSDGVDYVGNLTGLAHGGIVTGPTQAVIGEGGDNEAVIPLNSQGRKFLSEAMGEAGGKGVNIEELNVNASSYAEGRAAARGFKDELRSHNFD